MLLGTPETEIQSYNKDNGARFRDTTWLQQEGSRIEEGRDNLGSYLLGWSHGSWCHDYTP